MREVWALMVEPQRSVLELARRQSGQIRRQAGELVAARRTQEATQLLMRLALAAVDTKDASFICETLLGVATDLAPIDPAQSEFLRAQARSFADRLAPAGATVGP